MHTMSVMKMIFPFGKCSREVHKCLVTRLNPPSASANFSQLASSSGTISNRSHILPTHRPHDRKHSIPTEYTKSYQNASKRSNPRRRPAQPAASRLPARHRRLFEGSREQECRDCRIFLCGKRMIPITDGSGRAEKGGGRPLRKPRTEEMKCSEEGKTHGNALLTIFRQAGVAFLHSSWSEVLLPP